MPTPKPTQHQDRGLIYAFHQILGNSKLERQEALTPQIIRKTAVMNCLARRREPPAPRIRFSRRTRREDWTAERTTIPADRLPLTRWELAPTPRRQWWSAAARACVQRRASLEFQTLLHFRPTAR